MRTSQYHHFSFVTFSCRIHLHFMVCSQHHISTSLADIYPVQIKSVCLQLYTSIRLVLDVYQVNQKKSPLRLLLILQQCMEIFVRNFTRLLSDQIYTLSPSFIEIFLELTKLHSFNHDNPILRSLFPCLFV